VATETFSEPIVPVIGIFIWKSDSAISSRLIPLSSEPSINTEGPVNGASEAVLPDFSAVQITLSPDSFRYSIALTILFSLQTGKE
jgi:hypothetical protein